MSQLAHQSDRPILRARVRLDRSCQRAVGVDWFVEGQWRDSILTARRQVVCGFGQVFAKI